MVTAQAIDVSCLTKMGGTQGLPFNANFNASKTRCAFFRAMEM
jgi:hypothetical protein